ncbi:NAD-dependent epimerase/dehydratase family protein [Sphingorhabdus arenilitoris]|uniref:NAD-dependent epimerase/dehydratase family protein n=1 Tax=Sphingorhabdus arenilitoris TaxID=1490041 RepID=A0ABV8RD76_9SPHN
MTGGTGYIGRWMLEVLRDADARLNLGTQLVVLTRDPESFADKAPHLAHYKGFSFVKGNVRGEGWPDGQFDYVIHAATDASADLNENNPLLMMDTIIEGTRKALDFTKAQEKARFVFLSSGAVYGAQPWDVTHVDEQYNGGPDCQNPRSAYGEGKRAAEMLCAIYAKQFGLDVVTARIFAALGPMLSLDIHFAAGNFIRDVLNGERIIVQGAGDAVRSLLYIADLTCWLWKMLIAAQPGSVYNMGSEDAITIADLARRISSVLNGQEIEILGKPDPGWNPGRYVPSTQLARKELGLHETVGLDDMIRRTAIWNGWKA